MASLDSSLLSILGDRTAEVLDENLGLKTISDLLRHYPRRYVIRGELTDIDSLIEGEEVTIFAKVESSKVKRIPGRKSAILETVVTDGRAKLTLTFFNQAWREKELRPGRQLVILLESFFRYIQQQQRCPHGKLPNAFA